jgi:hypothetical protein
MGTPQRAAELGTLRDLARRIWRVAGGADAETRADAGSRAGARAELDQLAAQLASRGELTCAQGRAAMAAGLAQEALTAWSRADLIHCIGQHLPDHTLGRDQVHASVLLEQVADRAIAGEEVLGLDALEWPRVPNTLRRADGQIIYRVHGGELYATRASQAFAELREASRASARN